MCVYDDNDHYSSKSKLNTRQHNIKCELPNSVRYTGMSHRYIFHKHFHKNFMQLPAQVITVFSTSNTQFAQNLDCVAVLFYLFSLQ